PLDSRFMNQQPVRAESTGAGPRVLPKEVTMTRILVAFVLALSLAACATLAVYTDYNPAAQFSSYRTYTWREKPAEGSPLMNQRIVDAINYQLRNKGWNEDPSGD